MYCTSIKLITMLGANPNLHKLTEDRKVAITPNYIDITA